MKKNILKVMSLLFVALFLFVAGNRVFAKLSIPNNTKAQRPNPIPEVGDKNLYGTVTETFDFSKLQFSAASGGTDISGKSDLKKIILGKLKNNITSTSGLTLDTTFDNWFTAYCLDNTKKYPEYGLLTSTAYLNASTDQEKVELIILAAISLDDKVQAAVRRKGALNGGNLTAIQVVATDGSENFYDLDGTDTATTVVNNTENLETSVTIHLKKIDYYQGLTPITVSAADILRDSSATSYDLVFKGKDILLEQYEATNNSISGYDHALWIIEHSYPTLGLRASVEAAKVNYETLQKEICVLEGHTYDDATNTCEGFAELEDYVENYVYGVVQYAIWKSTSQGVGLEIGTSVTNSTQLNKLYQYLIRNRSEYRGYSTKTFANKITVVSPKTGKEQYKETSSAYIYGPYTATYDVLEGGNMSVSVTNADKTGITIIDEEGEEISEIENGGSFYIQCKKSANISNVSVSVKLDDASVFNPTKNRGRIYRPLYNIEQNVMSGGEISKMNLEATAELLVNPQTGVENVALLLMVTLVAFTLAYLLLSYKQKPIQLS